MKEVTRVHIAKTSYDIETTARKELEKYISKLELYAEDPDILEDIEIRITELLSERGIQKGGVIASDDVVALRAQLGEPHDFASGDDTVASVAEEVVERSRRRLYRDKENALLGGVLSGLAKYFGISVLWPRLAFLILLVGSFGTVLVVYLVMWLIVPLARTVAEKLELEGKPVTLESIRARGVMSEQEVESASLKIIRKVILFTAGLASLVVALGAIITVLVVLFGLYIPDQYGIVLDGEYRWMGHLAMALLVTSGLALAALGILLAYADSQAG